jgi:hypothetical protein
MPAARRGTKSSAPSNPDGISVVMDIMEPKKNSVRFKTEADGVPFSNIYVSSAAYTQLGRPGKLKVTIEAVE